MRLTQINHFMAVVAHGGVRPAARIIEVAPPVLTRSVRELERELGVQLIERTGHGLVPTASGAAFAASARIIQNELKRIEQGSLKQAAGASTVTLGLAADAISLVTALPAFLAAYPDADLRIIGGNFGALKHQLREGRIDFGVGILPPDQHNPSLKKRALFRTKLAIVGRRGHPLAAARSLQELMGATWVAAWNAEEGPAYGQSGPMRELFKLNRLPLPRSFVRCNASAALLTLLAQSDAIGVLDHWQIEYGLAAGKLHRFEVRAQLPSFTVYAFHRADAPLATAAAAMIGAFRAEARRSRL